MAFFAIGFLIADGKSIMQNLDELHTYYYHDYPDYYEVMDWLSDFADENSDICIAESLGFSTRDSLPIWALKISDNPAVDEDEITVMVNGSIHAEEIVGTNVCQFLAETLAAAYGIEDEPTRFVDNYEIWIVPIVNPEGYQVVMEGLDYTFRKNKRDNNEDGVFNYVFYHANDTDGVDLNRNFPYNWDGPDAVDEMHSSFYRGPSPASEQETQAMIRLCERENFTFSIWYHSSASGMFNEKVIYPYKYQDTIICPDQDRNAYIAMRYASTLRKREHGVYIHQIGQRMHGNSTDWEYYRNATLAFMTEIGTETQPPWEIVEWQKRNHYNGLEYLFQRTLDDEILRAHVYDSTTGEPIRARIEIEGRYREGYTDPRYTDSLHGAHYRLIMAGDYNLWISAEGYHDKYIDISIERGVPFDIDIALSRDESIEENPIDKPQKLTMMKILPNPFNSACELEFNRMIPNATINIYAIDGKIIDEIQFRNAKTAKWIPDADLPSGIYLIGIDGEILSRAIFIK